MGCVVWQSATRKMYGASLRFGRTSVLPSSLDFSRRIRFSCLKDGTAGRGAFRLEPTRPSFGAGFCGGEGMGVSGPVPPRTPPTAPPKTAVEDEAWPCAALGVLPGFLETPIPST